MPRHSHMHKSRARRLTSQPSNVTVGSGYALTVFRGNEIRRFPIRLISPLPSAGTAGLDLILARAAGDIIDFYGGVPYGTSGGPVYISGSLVGAISTMFYPDAKLIGITPAAAMLALSHEPGMIESSSLVSSLVPSPARVTVTGLSSGRALGELSSRFGPPLPGQAMPETESSSSPRLQPGSAVAAALLMGDIKMGFIGTATIVEGDQVYAFGHPLLFSGPTSLPLTTALIADTARGNSPDKIGVIGNAIGSVLQDRAAGIYARLGMQAKMIPLQFTVRDENRNQVESLRVDAAPLPSEIPFLIYIAALESLQRAMNRVGGGSAIWDWTIKVAGNADPTVVSGGTYDPFDIGGTVAAAMLPTVEQLIQAGSTIESVGLTASVTMRKLPELEEKD